MSNLHRPSFSSLQGQVALQTRDLFLAVHNLGLIQRQAGVERETGELVVAYSRLLLDSGEHPDFSPEAPLSGTSRGEELRRLMTRNPDADPDFLGFLALYAEEPT